MKRKSYRASALASALVATALFSSGRANAVQVLNETVWLRTPVATPPSTLTTMTCDTCQSPTPKAQWRLATTGLYSILLPGKAHAADEPGMFHAMAFGSPGVACGASDGGISGRDQYVSVSCIDANRQPVNSRFELYYELEPRAGYMDPSGGGDPHGKRAFATVFNTQLMTNQSYNPAGPAPTLMRNDVGRYAIYFSQFIDSSNAGNALVTSLYPQNQCTATTWGLTQNRWGTLTGSVVYVSCRGFGTYVDAAFAVSLTYWNGLGGSKQVIGQGRMYSSDPSAFSTYTPPLTHSAQSLDLPSGTGLSPMSVTRNGPGDYTVKSVPGGSFLDTNGVMASPVNGDAVCGTTAVDGYSARLACTVPGTMTPVDTKFTMQLGRVDKFPFHKAWSQVTFQNFGPRAFDVGYGLWCAQEITGGLHVKCGTPASMDGAFALPAMSVTPKSVAILNTDRTNTVFYVLGDDDNTRVFAGDISRVPANATTFGTYQYSIQPVLKNTNQVIGIKRIVTLSKPARMVVGLTAANQLVEVTGTWTTAQWLNMLTLKALPAGVTIKDISHGADGLYVLSTANAIYRVTMDTVTQLPALPNGLLPITVGGPYVITNAGANANGSVLCTAPYDTNREAYTCPGDAQRFYYFAGDGSWHPMNPGLKLPTEEDPVMSNSVNPFASPAGGIVDARAFDGNLSEIWAWQTFSRLYRFIE